MRVRRALRAIPALFRIGLPLAAAAAYGESPSPGIEAGAQEVSGWPGGPAAAAAALRSGRYEEAEALYREALEGDAGGGEVPRTASARRGLAETLRLTGRYQEALRVLDRRAAEGDPDPDLLLDRARIHLEIGESEPARDLLRRVSGLAPGRTGTSTGTPRLEAETLLGLLELRLGHREAGFSRLDGVIAAYNQSPAAALGARGLTAAGRAAARLGFQDSGLFRDALRVFDEAAALDPADPLPHLLAGELLLDKFNSAEASKSFEAVLRENPRHPRALYGRARIRERQRGAPAAPAGEEQDALAAALAANPNYPPARALEIERLLDRERLEEARRLALRAAEELPAAPEVLAALGAVRFLAGEDGELAALEDGFRTRRPGDPSLEIGLASVAERQRRYREATRRARAALRIDPVSAAASRLLGLNLLRLGAMEEGRQVLEAAFARDPFDALVKNTLDLLDELDGFEVVSSPPFEFVLPPAEAALLAPQVEVLAREALDSFRERYGFEPAGTVRIEFYDRSADFSVRTVGIPGIGAHGVCFGNVIALESPSAREIGAYHWASTLWHELGHTVSMGMTGNRIPRWFTEGLSLLEERRRFGDGVGLGFLLALRDDRLLDIPHLNDGFIRPSFPGQLAVSYFHASLVVEAIEAEYGFGAIVAMLDGFRAGRTTSGAIRDALEVTPEMLDAAVDSRLEERFGATARGLSGMGPAPLAGVGPPGAAPHPPKRSREGGPEAALERAEASPADFLLQLRAGVALFEAGRDDEAEERFERAAQLAPEYGGLDGPQGYLSRIFARTGRPERARAALSRHLRRAPAAYDSWLRLAEMRAAAGDPEGAAAALVSAIEAYPMLPEPHERLADSAAAAGRSALEVRARRAVLATDPPDRAEALHALALAHFRAGDRAAARRRVLEALEIAPTFDAALRLLLDLRRGA